MRFSRFVLFAFFSLFEIVENKRHLKSTNLKCISLREDIIIFKKCALKAISRHVSEANVESSILQKPINKINIILELRKLENIASNTLFNVSLDVCQFMKDRKRYPISNFIYESLDFDRYSNMNHECPYEGDTYVRGYRTEDSIISNLPFPLGNYVLAVTWFFEKQKACIVEGHFKFYEDSNDKSRPKN